MVLKSLQIYHIVALVFIFPIYYFKIWSKAKPVARQGRKATGFKETAGLPLITHKPGYLFKDGSVFLFWAIKRTAGISYKIFFGQI